MIIKEKCSYSRYRGVDCNDRYDAVDDYFRFDVDGNIICTDTERDIDSDGNIILITKDEEVLHIGQVPFLEDGAGKPDFSLNDKGNIVMRYKVFYDNSHHHAGIEEEVIDTHLTPERKEKIEKHKLILYLSGNIHACNGGRYRNRMSFYLTQQGIEIYVEIKIVSRFRQETIPVSINICKKEGRYFTECAGIPDYCLFKEGKGIRPLVDALKKYEEEKE